MSSDDVAIRIERISKRYEIYDQPRDRLKQFILPRLRRATRLTHRDYFHEFWALKDISFDVRKGETVGIVGRNGSGKSTLLQIVCGTLAPTTGSVAASGRIAALLELGSGFNPEFTGRENVYLNGALLGLGKEEIDARFDDIAAFADIGEFIEQPVKTYSSGMQVRLAFAVQAMVDPDILVVDEALAVGDEKFQRKCFARIEKLKSDGTSILFVSHAAPQVVELCERALLLERGERLLCAHPLAVTRAYQKLIYAPENEQGAIAREYRSLDASGSAYGQESLSKLLKEVGAPSNTSPSVIAGREPTALSTNAVSTFDPGLVPDTTTIYQPQGAEIQSIQIVDYRGNAVNVLQPGHTYRLVVSGKFLSELKQVFFGIHIRNISGTEITGQRYPAEGKQFADVMPGQTFEVTFSFNMVLLPAMYFVGGGVWSEQGAHCAHRILDAAMFRVAPNQGGGSFGYFDASADEPRVVLS